MGKAGGVAFGKAVVAEAADLLEYLCGELLADAFGLHARDEAVPVTFDPSRPSPGGHVTPELICFPGRVVRRHYGQPHDLLLEGSGADRIVGAIRPGVRRGEAAYAAMT